MNLSLLHDQPELLNRQLKEACKFCGARWAVWMQRAGETWTCFAAHGLNKTRLSNLADWVSIPTCSAWLAGSLAGGRSREKKSGNAAQGLGCERVFSFPAAGSPYLLLVGADQLTKEMRHFLRILSISSPSEMVESQFEVGDKPVFERLALGWEASYDPDVVLSHILDLLVDMVPCQAAYLAVREGKTFRIEALKGFPTQMCGRLLDSETDEILSRMSSTREGVLSKNQPAHVDLLPDNLPFDASLEWLRVPVVIGRRMIGEAAFVISGAGSYSPSDLKRARKILDQAAYAIETAMIFTDTARYLQQFALLNELALSASSGIDTDEAAHRVIERLKRTFQTELVGMFLLTGDGLSLRGYGSGNPEQMGQIVPLKGSLPGYALEQGRAIRLGNLQNDHIFSGYSTDFLSALIVPLKYHGKGIGVIALQSTEVNAFNAQDENLLSVIATHLAGLFSNAQLVEEARERARNLSLIHEVVKRVVGLPDVEEIVELTALLIARYFHYEFAVILIMDKSGENLLTIGAGGTMENQFEPGFQYPVFQGITGRVYRSGKSYYSNDVTQDKEYYAFPGWQAGSAMCVPLKDMNRVFGLINVERSQRNAFTENDLLVLESLAGIFSSGLMAALRNQELQERIHALQMAEARLIRSARLAAVGELAAGVAHELNNPLTTVMGFVELVKDGIPKDQQAYSDLELAFQEAQRARSVVRRLLDFSRQTESARRLVDLNELIQDVLALVQHQVQSERVQVNLNFDDNLPQASVDPEQIKQVLLNLIQNAMDAMRNKSKSREMTLSTMPIRRNKRSGVEIQVQDTGSGIAPENLDKIFEPFFTTRPVGEGTGLGLSVSYGIVSGHGGTIDVHSQVNEGSIFTVWLPLDGEIKNV